MKTISFSHNLLSEMVVSLIVLFVLITTVLPSAIDAIFGKVKTLEAFSLSQGVKQRIVEYYAHTGKILTSPEQSTFKTQGQYVENIQVINGTIHVDFAEQRNLPKATLSFRTAVLNKETPYALFWVCGNAEPKQDFQWQAKLNQTSLPTPYLLNQCRQRK